MGLDLFFYFSGHIGEFACEAFRHDSSFLIPQWSKDTTADRLFDQTD
jgi:hypothetical protein